MPSSVVQSSAQILNVYQALYGKAPSYALFADYKATVSSSSTATFAQQLASGFKSLTGPEFANLVLSNLGINDPVLATAFGQLLDGYGLASRGQILVNMTSLLAGLENDAKYGAVAKSFNAATDANFAYASSPANTVPSSPNTITADPTYTITTSPDTASANKFTSIPAYTPGGNNFVNTLQDEDTLTGVGTNPTLSVTLGSVNDAAEATIVPKLINIQTVNIESTGTTAGINFQDSSGLATLTVNRITQSNATLTLSDINPSATTYNVNNATRAGVVTFASKEESLTGTAETLAVNVNNARASALNLTEGTDGGSDAGYYFETVNVTTTGNNDLDAVTVQQNGMEDTLLSLTAGTTKQTLNVVANGGATSSLEINNLTATGVEFMTVAANARVDIAANKMIALAASNDGITTPDLETLTITGASNVMIDGLDTTKLATKTLTVSAGTMTGDLKLGVATASDGSSSGTYATRADKDLAVTSGSGNDQIVTYTTLAGDITTNAGDDTVRVGGTSLLDVEGVSTISTGEGNDTVTAKDLLATANDKDEAANTNFDDTTTATITTGAGNDTVTVGALTSTSDWDNITLTDGNLNDLQFIDGATIETGAGADSVTFTTIAEGALISTGDDADTVTVSLTAANGTILAEDTDADATRVVTATNGDSGTGTSYTDEVTMAGVADRLGAVVDTGAGNDAINFTDASSIDVDATSGEDVNASNTIVARDALLAGGAGTDTLSITTLDAVIVTVNTSDGDVNAGVTGTQTDINANVTGVETLNLTVANQVVNAAVTNTAATVAAASATTSTVTFNARYDVGDQVTVTVGGEAYTHTVALASGLTGADVALEISALITADGTPAGSDQDYSSKSVSGAVLTIVQDGLDGTVNASDDAALTTTSSLTNSTAKLPYATGNDNNDTDGAFTADVLRFDADLATINLTSQEQILETGPATEIYVAGTATAFTLRNMREGIALTLTAHDATGVSSNAVADDTLLLINSSTSAVTTNSGAKDATVTINWDNSGENNDSAAVNIGSVAGALLGSYDVLFNISSSATTDTTDDTVFTADTSDKLENFTINVTDALAHSFDMGSFADFGTATTSLTVNTAGPSVAVDAVSVDRIAFNNAAGTAVTSANVTLRVNAGNNYNITTGSGTDIIDLRADNVQSDDGIANTTAADTINGGAGRDVMIVLGNDSLGNNDLAASTIATQIDDDVFENINAVETVLIDTASASTTQDITLNEAAKDLGGVDTLRWVGAGTQTTYLVIGNDFSVVAGTGNGAFDGAATGLLIDASAHTGVTGLVIESKADDADQDVVNMDVRVNATAGVALTFVDPGVLSERVEVRVTTTSTVNTTGVVDSSTTVADGVAKIVNVDTTSAIDKITMYDGAAAGDAENSTRDTVTVEADWTNDAGTFEFDASRLGNTDSATDTTGATGGMTFTVETGDLADIIVRGGANSDSITTLAENDTIYGGGGNDTILGAAGVDYIYGEAGDDLIGSSSTTTSESGNDVIDAGAGADTVYLAAGNDAINLGSDTNSDNLVAYGTSNAAVATLSNSQAQDTVTNFTSGTDKVTISLFGNDASGATADVINLTLFAVAADLAAGDNTLTGTSGSKVQGDGFYSTATSQLLIDLDGDGDITTNDLSIGITGAVAAGDLNFVVTAGEGADTVSAGTGADTIVLTETTPAIDTVKFAAGTSSASITTSASRASYSGNDSITAFALAGGDVLDLAGTAAIAASTAGTNGADSTAVLTAAGTDVIKSHAISSTGIVTFDDADTFVSAETLGDAGDVGAAIQYLTLNDIGNAGDTVIFAGTGNGGASYYAYQQIATTKGATGGYIVVELVGVTATGGLITSGTTASSVLIA